MEKSHDFFLPFPSDTHVANDGILYIHMPPVCAYVHSALTTYNYPTWFDRLGCTVRDILTLHDHLGYHEELTRTHRLKREEDSRR